jgi:hypothetical protein
MNTKLTVLTLSLLSSALLLNTHTAVAQTSSPPRTTATRPAATPPNQTSIPNNDPPASGLQTTGQVNQDPTTKKMNEDEMKKVKTEGK